MLEHASKTIDHLISEGHYVYLHSTQSQGRSPIIAAAYLIDAGKSKKEAMDEVKRVRLNAWSCRDGNYAGYLDEFEKKCRTL